jgi:predicted lipoprotein with Yx(FWY)xxD motif
MRTRSTFFAAFVAAVTALSVGCGGSAGTGSQTQASPSSSTLVKTASATVEGKSQTILVGASNGLTLYYFTPDKGGKITCVGKCAENWPPLIVPGGQSNVSATSDITGKFTTAAQPEGKGQQVLYNGWPLYYWVADKKPGDVTGHRVGGNWFVATPDLQAGA